MSRFGKFVRIDVYKSLKRANQRDIVVECDSGTYLVQGISEGEIRDRRFSEVRHMAEISGD